MYTEIGVLAVSRIPKGVLFGSLPTRLIKSKSSNDDEQKFGFVEVQYTNGKIVSQYGPKFNWMKYVSASSDIHEQNIEAFVDASGEISFETSRDIERGQELLYTFGKQHRVENDETNVKQHGQRKHMLCKHENRQEYWSAEKHNSYKGNGNGLKPTSNRDNDQKINALAEKTTETALQQLDDATQRASRNLWSASSFEKSSPKITPNDQTRADDKQLPWFSELLRMSRYHQQPTTDDESLDTTNGIKACRQDNVNWYQVPVAVARPLGCTCTWSQPYFPRKTCENKAAYGSYVERRPRSDDNPDRAHQPVGHHAMNLRQRRVPDELQRTREMINSEENFEGFAEEKGVDKMTGDTQHGDVSTRNSKPESKNNESNNTTDDNEGQATAESSKNVAITPSTGIKALEHDNKKHVKNACSDHKQNQNTNENAKHGNVEELATSTKPSNDQARNGSRFVCDYCGKSYCRRYVLKIHMRTHTGHKPLHCTVCWKSFGDPSNLKKHVRSHARKNAIYTCEHCGRGSFYRLCDLVRHIKFRHRLANAAEKWPNSGGSSTDKKQDGAD